MKRIIVLMFCIVLFIFPSVTALWFNPETPPPQIINNNTNLTVNQITANAFCDSYGCITNISSLNVTAILNTNYSLYANSSDYWDNLDTPADISLTDLNGAEQSIWDWGFIKLGNITLTFIDDLISGTYVPYTGATNDVDLGIHDLTVDDITADDLWVTDDTKLGDDVDIGGGLYVNSSSEFTDNVAIINNDTIILEVETTNPKKSTEFRLLADGNNDLYIYTYGSYVEGEYYDLPKGNTSIIDAQGERLIVGTFDTSPMYLATDKHPRWIVTEDGYLIPFVDDDVDIGNVSNRVRDIYLVGEDDTGGLHFVEDDGTQGNLSMDDDFNLLWNGNIIVNASGNFSGGGGIISEYDPLWSGNQTDYLNSTDYIINITAVNASMKEYVDSKTGLWINVSNIATYYGNINVTENIYILGNISLDGTNNGGVMKDSLDVASIDWDNRRLYAQDGIDIVLDYFTVGVADFGDNVIKTTGDVRGGFIEGDGSQLQNVNYTETNTWTANQSSYDNSLTVNASIKTANDSVVDYVDTNYLPLTGGTVGTIIIDGNLTIIGSYINATVTNQYLNGSLLPGANNLFDIGSGNLNWKDGLFSGNINASTFTGDLDWHYVVNGLWLMNESDPLWTANMSLYLSVEDYILNITAVNASMKAYVDAQDVIFNDSMNDYITNAFVNITGDTMTGNLGIKMTPAYELDVNGTIRALKNLIVGNDTGAVGFTGLGDLYVLGNTKVMEGVFVEAQGYGAGLEVSDNDLEVTHTNIFTANATLNATTQILFDSEASFDDTYKGQVLRVINSAGVSFSGATGEITMVIDSTHIILSFGAAGTDPIPDATGMSYIIYPAPTLLVLDNGDVLFVIGDGSDASFKVRIDNGTNAHGVHIVDHAGTNAHIGISLEMDSKDYDGIVGQNIYMYSSTGVDGISSNAISLEGDATGFNNSLLHFIDVSLLGEGVNNNVDIIHINGEVSHIIHQGSTDELFIAYVEDVEETTNFKTEGLGATLFANNNEYIYLGANLNFTTMGFSLAVESNKDLDLEYYYCKSDGTYLPLTGVTDTTEGMQISGTITFVNPSDRGVCNNEFDGTAFANTTNVAYIALKRTLASVQTEPIESLITIGGSKTLMLLQKDMMKLEGSNGGPELCTANIAGAWYYDSAAVELLWCDGSAWTAFAVASGDPITTHNLLAGIQGGTGGEYYHLTSAEYTELQQGYALDSKVDTLGNWSFDKKDYLNSTDYIINITSVNASMKNYVDTKSQYDNDTNTWTANQTNYLNSTDYILNITAVNTSMKNYVDSLPKLTNESDPLWTANQSNYYNRTVIYNRTEIDKNFVNISGDKMTGMLNVTNQMSIIGSYPFNWYDNSGATKYAYIMANSGELRFSAIDVPMSFRYGATGSKISALMNETSGNWNFTNNVTVWGDVCDGDNCLGDDPLWTANMSLYYNVSDTYNKTETDRNIIQNITTNTWTTNQSSYYNKSEVDAQDVIFNNSIATYTPDWNNTDIRANNLNVSGIFYLSYSYTISNQSGNFRYDDNELTHFYNKTCQIWYMNHTEIDDCCDGDC